MKICPAAVEFFFSIRTDGQTDRQTWRS